MRTGLKVLASTSLILISMVVAIAAGPGSRAVKAASFGPVTTRTHDPPLVQVDITGLFWSR